MLAKGHTLFYRRHQRDRAAEAEDLVEIAIQAAKSVKVLGFKPRLAFMSYSTFGNPMGGALGEGSTGGRYARRDGGH